MVDTNKEYMLTTSKIKKHWMMDAKWTVQDKLNQYKGIIQLYDREKKIILNDTSLTKEHNIKRMHLLRESIKLKRNQLNQLKSPSNITKAKTFLHQTLKQQQQQHKQLQLKYQNQNIEKVIDNLKQQNYEKKKENDHLIFKRKQKTNILKELKLKIADLKDRAHTEYPLEQKAQIINGRISDTKLKNDVGITIQRNFKNILNIMKKDAVYFDSILISLEMDNKNQARCLYRTTQLGQLATEYLDDRIHDYKVLEQAIMQSMQQRHNNIKLIKHDVKQTTNFLKKLLTNTSNNININTTNTNAKKSNNNNRKYHEIKFNDTIKSIESILKFIQKTCYVSQYDEILPRIQQQHQQFSKLFSIANKLNGLRDRMIIKQNHAHLMYDTLITRLAADTSTYQYIEQKKKDTQLILEYDEFLKEINKEYCKVSEIYLNIRLSLQFLHELTQCVTVTVTHQQEEGTAQLHSQRPVTDVDQLLPILNERYQLLINHYIDLKVTTDQHEQTNITAIILYQQALMDASNKAHAYDFDQMIAETSLVSDIEIDDPSIPNSEDIKKRSANIVEDCAKKDDDQPIILLPLRGKTY